MATTLLQGDNRIILPTLAERSVQTVITSPPYWGLRDYGVAGQIGLEATIGEYVAELVNVFALVWRVLRDDGTLFLTWEMLTFLVRDMGEGMAAAAKKYQIIKRVIRLLKVFMMHT